MRHQEFEQSEFLGAEVDLVNSTVHGVAAAVDFEVFHLENRAHESVTETIFEHGIVRLRTAAAKRLSLLGFEPPSLAQEGLLIALGPFSVVRNSRAWWKLESHPAMQGMLDWTGKHRS